MAWCEANGVDYIFGLAGNPVLHRFAYGVADDLKVRRAEAGAEKMRSFAAFDYAAGSWNRERRVVARLEATARGFDARYIVTSLGGEARHLYEDIYCARGQAENLIKLHKSQLASDRTSCQSPLANQFRLVREKSRGAAAHYDIDVIADDSGEKARAVTWERRPLAGTMITHPGVYCLRTNVAARGQEEEAAAVIGAVPAAVFPGDPVADRERRAGIGQHFQRAQMGGQHGAHRERGLRVLRIDDRLRDRPLHGLGELRQLRARRSSARQMTPRRPKATIRPPVPIASGARPARPPSVAL